MSHRPLFGLLVIFMLAAMLLPGASGVIESISDQASIQARVLNFNMDELNHQFITLSIEKIISYNKSVGSNNLPLRLNQSITLGYLWGDRAVPANLPLLYVGDTIIADIDYHYPFESHIGHLYSYELLCKEGEEKIDGQCFPTECPSEEILVNHKCIKLECAEEEIPQNNRCVSLNCTSSQKAVNHGCVELECKSDQAAFNHSCVALSCGPEEGMINHACVPLFCGLFKKASNHSCVSDPLQIILFSFILVVSLYLSYELALKKMIEPKSRRERFLRSKLFIVLLFFFSLFVVSIPAFLRFVSNGSLLMGEVAYSHANIAKGIIEGSIQYAPLKAGVQFYHLILAYLGSLFGVETVSITLPPLLGAITICLFYLLLRRLVDDTKIILISTLLLLSSPAFLYLASVSSPDALAIPALLLAIIFSLSAKKGVSIFGWCLLAMLSLSNLFIAIISSLFLFLAAVYLASHKKLRWVLLALFIVLMAIFYLFFSKQVSGVLSLDGNILKQIVTDFGGSIGFGIFYLVLICAGFISSWGRKRMFYPLHISIALLFAAMLLLHQNYSVYLNLPLAYLAGLGMATLFSRAWNDGNIKTLTIIILLCGLLFSTLSYTKRLTGIEPIPESVTSLQWLSGQGPGRVLTLSKYGSWVKYYSGDAPFPDLSSPNATDQSKRAEEIFYSRNLINTEALLSGADIQYILIYSEMKDGLVWNRNTQGLLFLLRNNETFRRIYKDSSAEIWEYTNPSSRG